MESIQKVTKEELECAIKAAENCYRRRIRIHKKKTIDELTGEVFDHEYEEVLSKTQCCTNEVKDAVMSQLMTMLISAAGVLSDDIISLALSILEVPHGKGTDYLSLLQDLAERGWDEGYYLLGRVFAEGDPKNGIYRNYTLARIYLNLSLKYLSDDRCEELDVDPQYLLENLDSGFYDSEICSLVLHIKGKKYQYEAISSLINEFIADDKASLYAILHALVGSDYYEGIVSGVNLESDKNELSIYLNAGDEGAEALKYALLERFGKMEIKVH